MLQVRSLDSVKISSVDHKALIDALHDIAEKIKSENRSAESIRLFGSFNKGNYTPESDIDVLIIMDKADRPFVTRRDKFAPYFSDLPFDVNILAYSRDEVDLMRRKGNTFIMAILSESREL